MLEEHGPGLGRPLVDTIEGSRHHHMKGLRADTLRALFAFDPNRRAIILIGGDKRGDWTGRYEPNIPIADDLYDAYLREETKPMPISKNDLLKRRPVTPERRAKTDEIKRGMELDVALSKLREDRGVSQTAVAEALNTSRPNVSRIEHETDVRLSTLQRYVAALGGDLEVRAVFADQDPVVLTEAHPRGREVA